MTEEMLLEGLLGAGIPAILALVFGHVVWAKPKHQSEQRGERGRALIGLLGGYGYFVMAGLVLLLLGQG